MAANQIKTFADIYAGVLEACKLQSSDTTVIGRIKRAINIGYQNRVAAYAAWPFMRESVDLYLDPKVTSGTISVTAGSTTAALSATQTPSRKGWLLNITGYPEVYRVEEHTAASATLTLRIPFNGTTDTAAAYTLWNPRVALPTDCQSVTRVRHDFTDKPLDNIGYQRYLEYVSYDPVRQGYPFAYAAYDHVDPAAYATISGLPAAASRSSAGKVKTLVFAADASSYLTVGQRVNITGAGHYSYNGNAIISSVSTTTVTYTGTVDYQESPTADTSFVVKSLSQETAVERAREILLFPGIVETRLALHVDYQKLPVPLENDTDEPWLPLEDREVLLLLGEEFGWRKVVRNAAEADRCLALAEKKLSEMKAKWKDTTDLPALAVSAQYLASKRRRRRGRLRGDAWRRYD